MKYEVNCKWIKSLIILFYVGLNFSLRAQERTPNDSLLLLSENYSFYSCSESKVPLFNLPVTAIVEIEIKTDFQKLFQTKESDQSRIEGILSYTFKDSKVDLPVKIKARGNTRFLFCKYKPLDIKFSSSVDSTIFDGIGEKLYITSHCGEKNGDQWIFKGTETEYRNRLLAEYYIYSMLETLETITRSVSLCKIKYIDIEDKILTEEYAFIIESDESVAKRCNLIKNKGIVHFLDESSLVNTYLINHFITNYDWNCEYSDSAGWSGHNIKVLKSNDNIGYIHPYDFDLNAIVFPDFWKNKSESFDEHCYLFQEMLMNNFSDRNKLEAPYDILIHIPAMRAIIMDSYMNDAYKQKFIYWLESYEFILENHLSKYKNYQKLLP